MFALFDVVMSEKANIWLRKLSKYFPPNTRHEACESSLGPLLIEYDWIKMGQKTHMISTTDYNLFSFKVNLWLGHKKKNWKLQILLSKIAFLKICMNISKTFNYQQQRKQMLFFIKIRFIWRKVKDALNGLHFIDKKRKLYPQMHNHHRRVQLLTCVATGVNHCLPLFAENNENT